MHTAYYAEDAQIRQYLIIIKKIAHKKLYAIFFASIVRSFVFVCVAMDTAEGGTGMVDLEATAKRRKVTIQFGELIISSDFDSGT